MLFHFCVFWKYKFIWLMCFCDMHIPENTSFLQNTRCLFTTYSGSVCSSRVTVSHWPYPWADFGTDCCWHDDWHTAVTVCSLFVRAGMGWCVPFLPVVVFGGTCYGRTCWLWQGSGEIVIQSRPLSLWSRGHKKPCIFPLCSYCDVCSGNHKESKFAQRYWVLCNVIIWQFYLVIFTICYINVQTIILHYTVKYDLLHMQ